jgi:hypothetical protein
VVKRREGHPSNEGSGGVVVHLGTQRARGQCAVGFATWSGGAANCFFSLAQYSFGSDLRLCFWLEKFRLCCHKRCCCFFFFFSTWFVASYTVTVFGWTGEMLWSLQHWFRSSFSSLNPATDRWSTFSSGEFLHPSSQVDYWFALLMFWKIGVISFVLCADMQSDIWFQSCESHLFCLWKFFRYSICTWFFLEFFGSHSTGNLPCILLWHIPASVVVMISFEFTVLYSQRIFTTAPCFSRSFRRPLSAFLRNITIR